jgi:ribosomal protein S18 acetylase RimI-like enzyme
MLIEEVNNSHINDILDINKKCLPERIRKEQLHLILSVSSKVSFICKIDEKVVGYIICIHNGKYDFQNNEIVNDSNYNMIYSLAVLKEHRQKGVAKKLLSSVILNSIGKTLQLQVRKSNLIGIYLYERFHFNTVETLKKYYPGVKQIEELEDGLLMECSLQSDYTYKQE